MAGSGMIVGGLLKGLGAGLSMEAAQRRENALIALRRQFQMEDETRAEDRTIRAEDRQETRTIAGEERKATLQVGLLALAQQYKREEWETEQQYEERLLRIKADLESRHIAERGGQERETNEAQEALNRETERLKSRLRIGEDAASLRLADELDDADRRGEIYKTEVNPDGFIVVTFENGRIVTTRTRGAASSDADEEGGTGAIAAARARRGEGGGTPAPSPTPRPRAGGDADMPTDKQAIERSVAMMVRNGQLAEGTRVGETVTAPAGALAPVPVTVRWDGKKWVYQPS